MASFQGGAVHGNGLDLLPEEGVDEDENTLDDISGDEVSRLCCERNNWDITGNFPDFVTNLERGKSVRTQKQGEYE